MKEEGKTITGETVKEIERRVKLIWEHKKNLRWWEIFKKWKYNNSIKAYTELMKQNEEEAPLDHIEFDENDPRAKELIDLLASPSTFDS